MLAAWFLAALYALRGLYDVIPFLLALGLSSIFAFLLVTAARVLYRPNLSLHGLRLRRGGRMEFGGVVLLACATLIIAFLGHAALVQFHQHEAERWLAESHRLQMQGPDTRAVVRRASLAARQHLAWVTEHGLLESPRVLTQLGSLELYMGEVDAGRSHLERALTLAPHYGQARYKRAELMAREGGLDEALDELAQAVRDNPSMADARRDLLGGLQRVGRLADDVPVFEYVVERRAYDPAARLDLGGGVCRDGPLAGSH